MRAPCDNAPYVPFIWTTQGPGSRTTCPWTQAWASTQYAQFILCLGMPCQPVLRRDLDFHGLPLARPQLLMDDAARVTRLPNGEPITNDWLQSVLSSNGIAGTVTSFEASDPKLWAQSHSVCLSVTVQPPADAAVSGAAPLRFHLKRIVPRDMEPRALQKWKRDLHSYHNEAVFYRSVASRLQSKLPVPRAYFVHASYTPAAVGGGDDGDALLDSTFLFLLQHVEEAEYLQASPLSLPQVHCTLEALARLHAAAWEDPAVLCEAGADLHPHATFWSLDKR